LNDFIFSSFDVDGRIDFRDKMNEGKEDPVVAVPNLVKDDLPTSTPMDTQDGNVPANHVDEKEKIRPNYDERRISLLNNPTYGVILGFLDKFRTHIDIQDYPLRLLKENLLSEEQNSKKRFSLFFLNLFEFLSS
jgi:hypothetical protein